MSTSFPASTYRLQISPRFTLYDAAQVCDYIAELGADAVYLSPILTSTTGSDHGYDWVRADQVDPQRGGEEGWQALVSSARAAELRIVVDIVPNHMGTSRPWENLAWWDVLTHGRDSAHAHWFDIDWQAGPIFLGVLGHDEAINELTLNDNASELHYYEHRFPVCPGTASPGDDPVEVHARQHYQLRNWQDTNTDLNYRRFFAVDTLAGLNVEDLDVFEATHERILRWVTEDGVDGLRIDHPDGLVDPGEYFERLRAATGETCWLVGEKILEPGEELPSDWPVQGTTGYDAMTEVNQLFVRPESEDEITAGYQLRTGDQRDMHQQMDRGKSMVAAQLFPAEISRIVATLDHLDLERQLMADCLAELAVEMPVYRTYLPDGVELLDAAADRVLARRGELTGTMNVLLPQLKDPELEAARRLQQLTGAVMAKGVEDTAYYRANRFIALNEVGGNPARFGLALAGFHDAMRTRQANQPLAMTALSTHDTKRGEDIRARLAVLSELPDEWARFAEAFADRTSIPNPSFGELVAQTLVATGPVARERLHAYVEKAMREASDGTTWTDPDQGFESAVHAAVDTAYDDADLRAEWDTLLRLVTKPGRVNSLGQKLVQLTMPGIPDVYQGTEIFDDSLVDPDNRRLVDYDALREKLFADGPLEVDEVGDCKQLVVSRALRLRREEPGFFSTYRELTAEGEASDHVVAFDRGGAITVATRLPVGLEHAGGWRDTRLSLPHPVVDVLTGTRHPAEVEVAALLEYLPVALLIHA